jgi:pilus assembly protein Flp/PilA
MKEYWNSFWRDRRGQDLLEYALAAGIVAIAGVAAIPTLSATFSNVFAKIASIIHSCVI